MGVSTQSKEVIFFAVRLDVLLLAGFSEQDFEEKILAMFKVMASNHPCVDLDELLLAEGDPFVLAMKDRERAQHQVALSSSRPRSGTCHKWVDKISLASSSRTFWQDGDEMSFPGYLLLPDRLKELLDSWQCRFPDDRVQVWNLSQSALIAGEGYSPCLTPGAYMWLPHRGRRMYGREAMSFQALHVKQWDDVTTNDGLLFDMAGNAFCAVSVLPVQLMALFVLGRLELGMGSGQGLPPGTSAASAQQVQVGSSRGRSARADARTRSRSRSPSDAEEIWHLGSSSRDVGGRGGLKLD